MKMFLLLTTLFLFVGCQAGGGGGSGDIISNHVPVADEFALTTNTNVNYSDGQVITFNLTFPIDVVVSGNPKLDLTIGGVSREANFVSVSSNVLTFQYTVLSGDIDSDGITVATTLDRNSASILYRTTNETSNTIRVPSLFSVRINSTNGLPPVTTNTSDTLVEDIQKIITLPYTDSDGHLATSCLVSGLTNVTITQACACAAGTCTVGVTGTSNYTGAASFTYIVTANAEPSNSSTATLTITPVDDASISSNITPASFNEDVQSVITLSYSDVDSLATSCSVTNLSNVTITQACACAAGSCTVGVTGSPLHYNGAAGFDFTVTSGGIPSNSSSASLTINSVSDAPITANITPANFNEDTQSIITLPHTVVGGDTATACAITSPTNVTVTQACSCAAGTCTVGVTGTNNYFGTASFNWTVSSGTAQSTSRSSIFTIDPVDDAASLSVITAKSTNKNTATTAIAFTFTDGDGSVCNATRLSMTSSDTAIVANASVTWGGTAPNCTAVINPVTNATGTTTITFIATDGGLANKTTSFSLSVNGPHLVWQDPGNVTITLFDFGTPGANTNITLKVKNVGNQVTTTGVAISFLNTTPKITLGSTTCSAALAAGATCDVTINWNDGAGGTGFKTETYTATSGSLVPSVAIQGTK